MRKNSRTGTPSATGTPTKRQPKKSKESKQSKKNSKKTLALSLKLTDDEGWGSDFSDTATSIGGSSDSSEDEWESSFDPLWVVDEHELELRRRWTDQKGFTTALPKAEGVLRRSPLATNSTLSVSFASLPAADHPSAITLAQGPEGPANASPASAGATSLTLHQLSYADLQSAAAPVSARSRHSPSSSPREPLDSSPDPFGSTSAASLLPALDLDRVVVSSLGSSASRRNTISGPHETRPASDSCSQWKVGKISPRDEASGGEDEGPPAPAEKNESEEGKGEGVGEARLSPRRTDLQISFERFEAHLARKKQERRQQQQREEEEKEGEVIHDSVLVETASKKLRETKSKKGGSERKAKKKKKKNARSLNKENAASKERRREDERRSYRRSQGSPPMLLRALEHGEGYLAEEDEAVARDSDDEAAFDGSGTNKEGASVSPLTGLTLGPWRMRAEGPSSGSFPLHRSRSSEQVVKARRMITKEDVKRDEARKDSAGTSGPASPERSIQSPNNSVLNNNNKLNPSAHAGGSSAETMCCSTNSDNPSPPRAAGGPQPHNNQGSVPTTGKTVGPELTWKTIWEGTPAEPGAAGSSAAPPSSSPSAAEAKKVLKRGLEGRSASLPPSPLAGPLGVTPPASPSLPPRVSPLPLPSFAAPPPASLASTPTPGLSSSSLLHRRRAESSGTPQPLLRMAAVDSNFHHLSHQHYYHRIERVRTMSPVTAKRQSSIIVPLAKAGRDAGGESGEIVAALLRTQSEEIGTVVTLDADGEYDDDAVDIHLSTPVMRRSGRVANRRQKLGRSGGEWRSRARESITGDDLAVRRSRIERSRSFAKGEDGVTGEERELLLEEDADEDANGEGTRPFDVDEVDSDDEEDLMIEAELTSFLKRNRSGSHRHLRDLDGLHSPLLMRHADVSSTMVNAAFEELDSGLESGESYGR